MRTNVTAALMIGTALLLTACGKKGAEGEIEKGQVVATVNGKDITIHELNAELQPLRSFVLPGGHPAAAYLHLARTTCRRAERLIAELASKPEERVSEAVLAFINRLSDFFFVASRWANAKGPGDQLWVPGKNL